LLACEWRLKVAARAACRDPGPVVLRRLNNAEYTSRPHLNSIASLEPQRIPVDGAPRRFHNTGNALRCRHRWSRISRWRKAIASHAMLLPDGIRFAPGASAGLD